MCGLLCHIRNCLFDGSEGGETDPNPQEIHMGDRPCAEDTKSKADRYRKHTRLSSSIGNVLKVLNPINRTANSRSTARRETLPDGVTTSVSRFVV